MQLAPEIVREAAEELVALWEQGAIRPVVGSEFPLADAAAAHAPDRGPPPRREGRPCSVARSSPAARRGSARRPSRSSRRRGARSQSLDLATGFDVGDAAAWESVGPVDFAFLNAGVATGANDIAAICPTSCTGARSARTSTASSSASGGWRR